MLAFNVLYQYLIKDAIISLFYSLFAKKNLVNFRDKAIPNEKQQVKL
jgi:hypothetical protein